ncbi:MAG: lipoyl(octanoyl) transferase LipB [Thermoplasmata archaeon]
MPRVVDWGQREYADALAEMRSMVRARRSGANEDTLILVEHPPVVTVGVEGDDGEAARSGFPVIPVERGGRGTYHGPGQLVGYPIVHLDYRSRDVRRFVHEVEEVVVDALAAYGVRAGHVSGRHGVWVDGERKIASIGIAVDHWVTFHGFALNVDLDLAPFEQFHPCGLSGSVMTSLARELGHPVSTASVKPAVIRAWNERFARGTGSTAERTVETRAATVSSSA